MRGVNSGQVKLVVCSDAMARGMDLPQVEVVVNYDSPTSIKVRLCALYMYLCVTRIHVYVYLI